MFIARWRVDARFGHKSKVIELLRRWGSEIAPLAGLLESRGQILSGSIGALEATVEHNWSIEDLAELERVWAKLGTLDQHRAWSEELEPHIVSGTSRWEIFRVTG